MKQQVLIEPPLYFVQQNLQVWCTKFHPNTNILAATLINGHVQILKYTSDQVTPIATITDCHRSSSRYCSFNPSGSLTCGQDKRLSFIDSNARTAHIMKKAHPNPINRVNFATQHIVLSGDDEGLIKIWDIRSNQCVFQANQQTQAITQLYFQQQTLQVLASSLDGTIAAYDINQGTQSPNKLLAQTDSIDQELQGMAVLKEGKYIACPTTEQSVLIYKRETLQTYVDRIKGLDGSIQAILKIDQNTILTGNQFGFVQGVSIKPNKILQVIGQHEEDDHFSVLNLSLSSCKNIVASTSHDNSIKFYDVSSFVRLRSQVVETDQFMGEAGEAVEVSGQQQSDLFQDMDSDEDDDSSQQQQQIKPKKKKKKVKINLKNRETQIRKDNQRKFFEGL